MTIIAEKIVFGGDFVLNKKKYFFLAICLFIFIFTCYDVFKNVKTVDIKKLQIDRELNENDYYYDDID